MKNVITLCLVLVLLVLSSCSMLQLNGTLTVCIEDAPEDIAFEVFKNKFDYSNINEAEILPVAKNTIKIDESGTGSASAMGDGKLNYPKVFPGGETVHVIVYSISNPDKYLQDEILIDGEMVMTFGYNSFINIDG